VVAYSTLSQLGYMALALGVGAWVGAIFHLMTHAFFKGLLFLGSGSVIHGMHEEQDIRKMGGLAKAMPITTWTFVIASLANAGVVPFAGFWSKDEIILSAWVSEHQPIGMIASVVALIAAFFTGLYMFRLVFLVFFGPKRYDETKVHPHESPPSMTVPLVVLAVPSVAIGLLVGWPPEDGKFHHFLAPVFSHGAEAEHADAGHAPEAASLYMLQDEPAGGEEPAGEQEAEGAGTAADHGSGEEEHHVTTAQKWTFAIISTIVALAGIAVAAMNYRNVRTEEEVVAIDRRLSLGTYDLLFNKWWWDEIYDAVFVRPLKNLSNWLWRVVDEGIIDAFVNGIAFGIGAVSQRLRHVQTGLVANYALAIALGMVLLVGIYIGFFSNLFGR
jgi:NADH-quinone oxidoreductase subunit L